MALCTLCGLGCPGEGDWGLCEHHVFVDSLDEWATANRIMCNFFHRKIVPQRVPPEWRERVDLDA